MQGQGAPCAQRPKPGEFFVGRAAPALSRGQRVPLLPFLFWNDGWWLPPSIASSSPQSRRACQAAVVHCSPSPNDRTFANTLPQRERNYQPGQGSGHDGRAPAESVRGAAAGLVPAPPGQRRTSRVRPRSLLAPRRGITNHASLSARHATPTCLRRPRIDVPPNVLHALPPGCRRDFYEILQVPKGANDAQLKRAYRKLALQYHPVRAGRAQGTCARPLAGCMGHGDALWLGTHSTGSNMHELYAALVPVGVCRRGVGRLVAAGQGAGHRGGEAGGVQAVCGDQPWWVVGW